LGAGFDSNESTGLGEETCELLEIDHIIMFRIVDCFVLKILVKVSR
jgi:hypothetical protein